MDEESAILRNSNSTEETNMPASSDCTVKSIALSVPDSAESTPNKPNPFSSDKIPSHFQQTPHHHFLHSSLHQHRRRRTSSSASSARGGLQDTDALAHLRCPHQQCGYRFETINDLNNHLMFGLHGIGDTKAVSLEKLFCFKFFFRRYMNQAPHKQCLSNVCLRLQIHVLCKTSVQSVKKNYSIMTD